MICNILFCFVLQLHGQHLGFAPKCVGRICRKSEKALQKSMFWDILPSGIVHSRKRSTRELGSVGENLANVGETTLANWEVCFLNLRT